MVFKKLFGSDPENQKESGVVWAHFNRKYETWHFGPRDEKKVVYDGIEKDVLYRFIDDDTDSGSATSYQKEIGGNYETVLFTGKIDEKWREKRKEDKLMYLVAQGSWDGENLTYKKPVLVVEKHIFDKLKNQSELAHSRPMNVTPRHLHQNMRKR